MKKNNVLKVLGIVALAGTITVFAGCKEKQITETPVNEAAAQTSTKAIQSSISLEKAIEIALENAGISDRSKAYFEKAQLDSNDKISHYDIEFKADGKEYDYEIAVNDGKILEKEIDKNEKTTVEFYYESNTDAEKITSNKSTPSKNTGYISIDNAKEAALKDAGVNSSDAVFEKAQFDGNEPTPHYDIEFRSNDYEYDYEINAVNGAVLERDKERDFDINKSSANAENFIGKEAAKEKAFAHAGIKAADVKRAEIELDSDEPVPHYDVDFVSGKYEYEYSINAKTGSVIKAEKDFND